MVCFSTATLFGSVGTAAIETPLTPPITAPVEAPVEVKPSPPKEESIETLDEPMIESIIIPPENTGNQSQEEDQTDKFLRGWFVVISLVLFLTGYILTKSDRGCLTTDGSGK